MVNGLIFAAIVALTNSFGTVKVDTLGANVMSYVPAGGEEVFFHQTAPRAIDLWYHGGMSVCWPWFGWNGDPGSAQHGVVWSREWKVVEREDSAEWSRLVLGLADVFGCRLTYEIKLDAALSADLSMRNESDRRLPVTTGLHPYFAVSHTTNIVVKTPSHSLFIRGEVDGPHPAENGQYAIVDPGCGRTIALNFWGNPKVVVWNNGDQYQVTGFGPDDWSRYVCVEPAVLPRAFGYFLEPGETRNIGLRVTVLAR